ncbi:MAG TPA: O-antigen ligase family protein [Solirubrobacterales bacterium]
MPHAFHAPEGPGSGQPRLSYPLGYWNADGLIAALGVALALWMSRSSLTAALRWVAVGLMPTALLALYFTYSRGGLLALLISCGCLIVLSHDRLWLLATLAIGAIGTVPAVLAAQASNSLAENLNDSQIVGEGLLTLGLLVVGSLLALALFAGLRRLESRSGPVTGQAVTLSRDPRLLRGVALAAVVVGIGIAVAVGGRAWDQFTTSDVKFPNNPAQHFGQLTGAGRSEFWRVAADAFEEKPVLGHGAGTYRFSWHLLRHDRAPNIDAHSLYLQAFAELGVVGGLLVLAMVLALLWIGFRAWQAARGPRRELYAALLGVCLAFAVAVGIDWFWQIAVTAAVFFLAAGVLVAARCAQLLEVRNAADGHAEQRRYGLAIGGLALAWIAALALVGPLLVDREIDASNSAIAAGNLPDAVGHAETAQSIEPWATTPYLQLGLLAEREGNYPEAIHRLDEAIDREEESWLLYYIRGRIKHESGDTAGAQADLREAQRLNPEEECLYNGFEGCG